LFAGIRLWWADEEGDCTAYAWRVGEKSEGGLENGGSGSNSLVGKKKAKKKKT